MTRMGPGVVLFMITLIAYLPSFKADFIWDDNDIYITQNRLIQAPDGLYRIWFTRESVDYYPMVHTAWWVQWRLFGAHPAGYHVVNVLLHACCAVLLWHVFVELGIVGAWLCALIWAVHPVNVETVTWISELKNILPMLFSLLSLLAWLRFEARSASRHYWAALGLFLLALLAKPATATFPLVLLGLSWWRQARLARSEASGGLARSPERGGQSPSRGRFWAYRGDGVSKTSLYPGEMRTLPGLLTRVCRLLPFLVLAASLSLVTIHFQKTHAVGSDIVHGNFAVRLAGAGYAIWFYLYKLLVPRGLCFIYPRWEIVSTSVISYLPLTLFVAALAVCWRFRAGWGRPFLAGLGLFVLNLLPVLGFFDIYFLRFSLVADHWQYVAMVSVIPLVIWLADRTRARLRVRREVSMTVGLALAGLLAVMTWQRQAIYRSEETLWRETVRTNPSAWLAQYNLGNIVARRGQLDEAIGHYIEAIRFKADYADAHNNLGNALGAKGRPEEALTHWRSALRYDPRLDAAHFNIGATLLAQHRPAEAIEHFESALKINPDNADARRGLAAARAQGAPGEPLPEDKEEASASDTAVGKSN